MLQDQHEVDLHRLRGQIAAMVASLGGLDVLVFTGGVGGAVPAYVVQAREDLEIARGVRQALGEEP